MLRKLLSLFLLSSLRSAEPNAALTTEPCEPTAELIAELYAESNAEPTVVLTARLSAVPTDKITAETNAEPLPCLPRS